MAATVPRPAREVRAAVRQLGGAVSAVVSVPFDEHLARTEPLDVGREQQHMSGPRIRDQLLLDGRARRAQLRRPPPSRLGGHQLDLSVIAARVLRLTSPSRSNRVTALRVVPCAIPVAAATTAWAEAKDSLRPARGTRVVASLGSPCSGWQARVYTSAGRGAP
ncbi:hypothetical protein ABT297_17390 [Dactylosporangium sp. NPDC000555]|uniref:hypothetical protein n=1 Tax=Dactylosporangium sp. NPDC000555 TaxID=3154260 RepID=UPI003333EAF0